MICWIILIKSLSATTSSKLAVSLITIHIIFYATNFKKKNEGKNVAHLKYLNYIIHIAENMIIFGINPLRSRFVTVVNQPYVKASV